jgi:two-component system response regulator FixJ
MMNKKMNDSHLNPIPAPIVYIVDDDEAVRDSLSMLLGSVGIVHASVPSAQALLLHQPEEDIQRLSGCIVMDIRMPGMSGMECQQRLQALGCKIPIIFVTGHGDVPMAVEAMKRGAFEFLQKPFREQELLDYIQRALQKNHLVQQGLMSAQQLKTSIESLTQREKEVMGRVIAGQANKVIAIELNLSQRTIEIHRANVMDKMQAKSLAELVRLVVTQE